MLHNVYLHTLFTLIESAKPHPYTGSFTTSFLKKAALPETNLNIQIDTICNK